MIINPKVSILTVYHNRRDHVVDSVESLLNQTYDNLEIIIVDDCSSDDTFNLLNNVVNNSPKVKLIQNKVNKGFTQTIIDTINNIDSLYVAIHGAGDISLPTRIEEQVKHLEAHPDVGMVTTDITNLKKPKFYKTEITLKDLLKKNRITHGAVMFKKEVYHQVGGYRSFFTTRQDKDLWFRMSLVTKIHFIEKKLYSLVNIKSTVSKSAANTGLPTLLSAFSETLIKERSIKGIDSLDLYAEKSALFFNPTVANPLFRRNFIKCILGGKRKLAKQWLQILIKINSHNINGYFYRLLNIIFK